MISPSTIAALQAAQDQKADIALLKAAVSIESITGNETPFARFLEAQMTELGITTDRAEFGDGRENTWGISAGDGPTLMIIGYTDTVPVRGWAEH